MRALYLILPILGILAIAYRYYSAFIAARVMALDDARMTPAHLRNDGQNYYPTHRLVLFGHHFAAITGAGPLIGPVLAAQFGFVPGLIWLVAGVCLAGAVHDFIILWASIRRGGRSLAEIAREEIGPVAGVTAADRDPLHHRHRARRAGPRGRQRAAGERLGHLHHRRDDPARAVHGPLHVPLPQGPDRRGDDHRRGRLLLAVIARQAGRRLGDSGPGSMLSREQLIVAMAAYGFVASVLPVWLLLCPRDYLSSFMKIGTIAFLVLAVDHRQPAPADAGVQPVHRRRRADHPGPAVPVRVHHHRLRRDLRLPRADLLGHDAQDDRPGDPTSGRSATARC